MPVYMVTGNLGGGKSLVAVGKIKEYLEQGRPVATNLDLNLEYLLPHSASKALVYRLPDKPSIEDLEQIGCASTSRQEEDNGLLVLDELATWFNSRTYSDKSRQPVINWLLHSRKKQWDMLLLVQDVDSIDKQARLSLGEHIVTCRRTDRLPIPVFGFISKLLGIKLKLTRMHLASVFYGQGRAAVRVDTWLYRGTSLFKAYDTNQEFSDSYKDGTYCYLPPSYLNLKSFAARNARFYMRMTKIIWRKYSRPFVFGMGVCFCFFAVFSAYFLMGGTVKPAEAVAVVPQKVDPSKININANVSQSERKGVVHIPEPEGYSEPLIEVDQAAAAPLALVNYVKVFKADGSTYFKFLHGGKVYSSRTFPFQLTWENGEPYARL